MGDLEKSRGASGFFLKASMPAAAFADAVHCRGMHLLSRKGTSFVVFVLSFRHFPFAERVRISVGTKSWLYTENCWYEVKLKQFYLKLFINLILWNGTE